MSSMDELVGVLKAEPSLEDIASGERIARVLQARMEAELDTSVSKKRAIPWNYISIAAAMLIVFLGVKYIPSKLQTPPSKTYSTLPAQRASFTLADGSYVILAPATKLIVTGRNVELQGEAVFTVNQHTGTPFTVKSGNTITRVLGTTFGVRAYDKNVQVIVSEGRVGIGATVASEGDLVTINNGATNVQHNANIAELMSWTSGTLTLRKVTLAEAFARLSRWYGIELRVSDPALLALTVDATFPATYNPGLIQDMAGVVGAHAIIHGHTITFSPDK